LRVSKGFSNNIQTPVRKSNRKQLCCMRFAAGRYSGQDDLYFQAAQIF